MTNEFDSIEPNTQVPKSSYLGTPNNQWGKVYAASGSFDIVTVSGLSVQPYDDSIVEIVLTLGVQSITIAHNLGTEFVDVQVYDKFKEIIKPNAIIVIDNNNIKLTFVEPQQGTVLIQQGKL